MEVLKQFLEILVKDCCEHKCEIRMDGIIQELNMFDQQQNFEEKGGANLGLKQFMHQNINLKLFIYCFTSFQKKNLPMF